MKRKRLVSLLLCAAMLLCIVPVSASAYPVNVNMAYTTKTAHDLNNGRPIGDIAFPITIKGDVNGQMVIEGLTEVNALLNSGGAWLKKAQPGDQFVFTLKIKNEMTMPLKNQAPNNTTRTVPVEVSLKCWLPQMPTLDKYFTAVDYNVFAAGDAEAAALGQVVPGTTTPDPLSFFRNATNGEPLHPAYAAERDLSIYHSRDALELASFPFDGTTLDTDPAHITYNSTVFQDPANPGAAYLPGNDNTIEVPVGFLQAGEVRYVHVWLQLVGHRPQTAKPNDPNDPASVAAANAENARLKANHDWLLKNQNAWMNQTAFISWGLNVEAEVLPVGYWVYYRELGTTTDLRSPREIPAYDVVDPVTGKIDPDGTMGLYPGEVVPYAYGNHPSDRYSGYWPGGYDDYVISGYRYVSMDTANVTPLGEVTADNRIILYYERESPPPPPPPPPTPTTYTVRFVRDTDLQEFPNSTKTFSGNVNDFVTYQYNPAADVFDGWTFTGRYYPSQSIQLTNIPADNVITLIYTQVLDGQTGYIVRFEDEYGATLRAERRVPNAGNIGDVLTYLYNAAIDAIDGYLYIYSVPGDGTITLRADIEDNVITLIYRLVVDVTASGPPIDDGSGGVTETVDVTSSGPPTMPPTGGFNWADLFFVGCGLSIVGFLYLFGLKRRRKEDEEENQTPPEAP